MDHKTHPSTTIRAPEWVALSLLPPRLARLLVNPARRQLLRALHRNQEASSLHTLKKDPLLSAEPISRINYHGAALAGVGAITVDHAAGTFRSRLENDPAVVALLNATEEADSAGQAKI